MFVEMKAKLIGLVVSIIIIVGVAIGLVIGVCHAYHSNHAMRNPLSGTIKPIQIVCNPTLYQEACVLSLNSVSRNRSATLKDYFQATANGTIDATNQIIDTIDSIGEGAKDPINKMAFEDCKEMLQLTLDELHNVYSNLSDVQFSSLKVREDELKNWLSATISYQQSCIDGIDNSELKDKMKINLKSASQLTSNVLAIISGIIPILNGFGIDTSSVKLSSRRLLNVNENTQKIGKHKYPRWFSNEDRMLAERIYKKNPVPNVIVAKDGSGQFKTINEAIASYPKNSSERYVIYVKKGIYNEQVIITKDQPFIFMYGDGPRSSIVTGKKSNRDGVSTYQTATFAVIGNYFIGKSMGFRNTAGPEGHQAVALRVQSDKSVFYNCRLDGYQDTLYAQAHRQFYRNCIISGTIDFIFGDASVVIQNCLIIVRKPMDVQKNTVTAHGKKDIHETTGIVIQNSRIVPEQKLYASRFQIQTFLGRPWREYSTAIIMQSMLADFIQPTGWTPWSGNFALDTLNFAEYDNEGPGANVSKRVKWKGYHVITKPDDAIIYTVEPFIQGDTWIPRSLLPFFIGLNKDNLT